LYAVWFHHDVSLLNLLLIENKKVQIHICNKVSGINRGEMQTIEATRWGRKIPPDSSELEARRRRRDGDVRENRRNWGRNAASSARKLTVVGEEFELQIAGVNLGDGKEATQRVHWPTPAILFPSASLTSLHINSQVKLHIYPLSV